LPDGFFPDQKFQFGYILEGLGMENVAIYSVHLEYFTTLGYILYVGVLVILQSYGIFFPRFGILYQKIWQPCFEPFHIGARYFLKNKEI
jgi:hypothetical protein